MPRGRTKSRKPREERLQDAFECFAKGMNDTAAARIVGVTRQTAAVYRGLYEKGLHARAQTNPRFLQEIVANTFRALEELDLVRADAWKQLEPRKVKRTIECPNCEHEWKETELYPVSDQSRAQYHNVLLKAQSERAKLLGLLGVKHEMFVAIMQVKFVQDKLLEFMSRSLCAECREALEGFLMLPELVDYMGTGNVLDVVDTTAVELVAAG